MVPFALERDLACGGHRVAGGRERPRWGDQSRGELRESVVTEVRRRECFKEKRGQRVNHRQEDR